MNNMKAEDWDKAREQMSKLSPADMQQHTAQMNQYLTAQQQYTLTASKQLKNEGNQLHSSGQYKAWACTHFECLFFICICCQR